MNKYDLLPCLPDTFHLNIDREFSNRINNCFLPLFNQYIAFQSSKLSQTAAHTEKLCVFLTALFDTIQLQYWIVYIPFHRKCRKCDACLNGRNKFTNNQIPQFSAFFPLIICHLNGFHCSFVFLQFEQCVYYQWNERRKKEIKKMLSAREWVLLFEAKLPHVEYVFF